MRTGTTNYRAPRKQIVLTPAVSVSDRIQGMRSLAVIRLLLVIALLLTQTGGLTHGIAHTLAEQSKHQLLQDDKPCELCAIYAQLGSSPVSHVAQLVPPEQAAAFAVAPAFAFFSSEFSAFAARAPPFSA